ncbi:MAG: serine/threonine protein kinase [Nannocystis sp.]|uniref:serine/threonine-protein kinase n=1 Tax=Nannocystis sp. TaxID=1962667 RepID=UPI00242742C8|nr:serine/threonine-protein kinase [Nannocystis sp.]MBK9751969.1 serine/threonine protein kinase [Nannocystis sp.]
MPRDTRRLGSLVNAATLDASSSTSEDAAPIRPGDRVARYQVIAFLGRGGMGIVYRAHDPQLDREIALKLLVVGHKDSAGRARLLREAKAAAKVRHPNVVTVHDAGEIDGRVFIAMELVDGCTLRDWLGEGQRSWQGVLRCLLAAGEGLAAAHAVGLVHRDFKPENVMVERSGRVRVLDFGLAREAPEVGVETAIHTAPDDAPVSSTITRTGAMVGTLAYMAPEQFSGIPADPRTDQFSFCVTAHECLYGMRPFVGATREALMLNVLDGNIVARPTAALDDEVYALLRRGLGTAPRDRHPTMDALLAQLREALYRAEVRPVARTDVAIKATAGLFGLAVVATSVSMLSAPGSFWLASAAARADRAPVSAPGAATPPGPTLREIVLALPTGAVHAGLPSLLRRTLPPSVTLAEDGVSLRIRGEAPEAWIQMLQAIITSVDLKPGEAADSRGPFTAPDGRTWMLLYLGDDDRDARASSIQSAAELIAFFHETGTAYALAEGAVGALGRASAAAEVARRPIYRKWCYQNKNMGERRCLATQAKCEFDADAWAGPGNGRRSCHGVR